MAAHAKRSACNAAVWCGPFVFMYRAPKPYMQPGSSSCPSPRELTSRIRMHTTLSVPYSHMPVQCSICLTLHWFHRDTLPSIGCYTEKETEAQHYQGVHCTGFYCAVCPVCATKNQRVHDIWHKGIHIRPIRRALTWYAGRSGR